MSGYVYRLPPTAEDVANLQKLVHGVALMPFGAVVRLIRIGWAEPPHFVPTDEGWRVLREGW